MANTGNTQQQINYGAAANDGQGDPLRTAFIKTDDNFDAIWNAGPVGSNITIVNNTVQSNNTNGNIVLRPNGVGVIQANAAVVPNATDLRDLGTANLRFRTAYIGSGGLSATGNITANTFFGNGSQLTGIASSYGNANVATFLAAFGSNTISTTGNVTANYFIGNGALLTGVTSYTNANVEALGESGWSGNIIPTANGVYSLGNATNLWSNLFVASNTIFIGGVPLGIGAGNVLTVNGEALLSNNSDTSITTTGNISANYFIGDGSLLTNLPFNASQIQNGTSNVEIATANGNVTVTANSTQTWTFGANGNLTAPGNITTTGNIDGGNVNATAVTADTVTGSNVDATDFNGGNLNNMTLGTQLFTNGQRIAGGAFDYSQLYVGFDGGDQGIALNSFGNAPVQINTGDGGANTYNWTFSNSNGEFAAPGNITTTGNVSGNFFIGDGSQLTGITANTANITSNVISFNTAAGISVAAGQMAWNSADGTVDIGIGYGNVVLQTGQETHYVVRNETGNVISDGTAVYCSGVTPSGRISIDLMTSNIDPVQFLGLATQDISNGVNGVVTWFGYVRDLDTRGTANTAISVGDENWAVGDKLYVHPTAPGKLTKVEPAAPNVKICVASVIIRNQTAGVLFVRPTTNLTAADLSDVQITTPAVNQFLVYAGNRWENTALDISLDTTPTLGGNLAGAGFNVSNVSTISATGNISGGNLITSGRVLASGNILGLNFATEGSVQASSVEATGNITGANLSVTGNITGNTAGFAIGYRDIPQVAFTGNATIAAADAGKHFYSTESTDYILTIADNSAVSWPVGTAITVVNRGTGNITVAQASGVSLYLAGNSSAGNRTVSTYGMATVLNVAANVWMINGTGVA